MSISDLAKSILSGAKNIGETALSGAQAMGGAVSSGAKAAGEAISSGAKAVEEGIKGADYLVRNLPGIAAKAASVVAKPATDAVLEGIRTVDRTVLDPVKKFVDKVDEKSLRPILQSAFDIAQNAIDQDVREEHRTGKPLPFDRKVVRLIPFFNAFTSSIFEAKNQAAEEGRKADVNDFVAAVADASSKAGMLALQARMLPASMIGGTVGTTIESAIGSDPIAWLNRKASETTKDIADDVVSLFPGLTDFQKKKIADATGDALHVGSQFLAAKLFGNKFGKEKGKTIYASEGAAKAPSFKAQAGNILAESAGQTFANAALAAASYLKDGKPVDFSELSKGAASDVVAQLGMAAPGARATLKAAKKLVSPETAAESYAAAPAKKAVHPEIELQKRAVSEKASIPFKETMARLEQNRESTGMGYRSATRENPAYAAFWKRVDKAPKAKPVTVASSETAAKPAIVAAAPVEKPAVAAVPAAKAIVKKAVKVSEGAKAAAKKMAAPKPLEIETVDTMKPGKPMKAAATKPGVAEEVVLPRVGEPVKVEAAPATKAGPTFPFAEEMTDGVEIDPLVANARSKGMMAATPKKQAEPSALKSEVSEPFPVSESGKPSDKPAEAKVIRSKTLSDPSGRVTVNQAENARMVGSVLTPASQIRQFFNQFKVRMPSGRWSSLSEQIAGILGTANLTAKRLARESGFDKHVAAAAERVARLANPKRGAEARLKAELGRDPSAKELEAYVAKAESYADSARQEYNSAIMELRNLGGKRQPGEGYRMRADKLADALYEMKRDALADSRMLAGEERGNALAEAISAGELIDALRSFGLNERANRLEAMYGKNSEGMKEFVASLYGAGKTFLEERGIHTSDDYDRGVVTRSKLDGFEEDLAAFVAENGGKDAASAKLGMSPERLDELLTGEPSAKTRMEKQKKAAKKEKESQDVSKDFELLLEDVGPDIHSEKRRSSVSMRSNNVKGLHSTTDLAKAVNYAARLAELKAKGDAVNSLSTFERNAPESVRKKFDGWKPLAKQAIARSESRAASADVPDSFRGAGAAQRGLAYSGFLVGAKRLLWDALAQGGARVAYGVASRSVLNPLKALAAGKGVKAAGKEAVMPTVNALFDGLKSFSNDGAVANLMKDFDLAERTDFRGVGKGAQKGAFKEAMKHNVREGAFFLTGTAPDTFVKRILVFGKLRDELGIDPMLSTESAAKLIRDKLSSLQRADAQAVVGRVKALGDTVYNHSADNASMGLRKNDVVRKIMNMPIINSLSTWTRNQVSLLQELPSAAYDALRSAFDKGVTTPEKFARIEDAATKAASVAIAIGASTEAMYRLLQAYYKVFPDDKPEDEVLRKQAELNTGTDAMLSDFPSMGYGLIKLLSGGNVPTAGIGKLVGKAADFRKAVDEAVSAYASGRKPDYSKILYLVGRLPAADSALSPESGKTKYGAFSYENDPLTELFLGSTQQRAASELLRDAKYGDDSMWEKIQDAAFGGFGGFLSKFSTLTGKDAPSEGQAKSALARAAAVEAIRNAKEFAESPESAGKGVGDFLRHVYGDKFANADFSRANALGASVDAAADMASQGRVIQDVLEEYGYSGEITSPSLYPDVASWLKAVAKENPKQADAFLQSIGSVASFLAEAGDPGSDKFRVDFKPGRDASVSEAAHREFGIGLENTEASEAIASALSDASRAAAQHLNLARDPNMGNLAKFGGKSVKELLDSAEKLTAIAHGSPKLWDSVKNSVGRAAADALTKGGGYTEIARWIKAHKAEYPFLTDALRERLEYASERRSGIGEAMAISGRGTPAPSASAASAVAPATGVRTESSKLDDKTLLWMAQQALRDSKKKKGEEFRWVPSPSWTKKKKGR